MFRKLILAAIVATTTLAAMGATASTAAADVPTLLPHHHFEVLAARGGECKSHGVFHLQARAEMVATRLRLEGYRVEIRQF